MTDQMANAYNDEEIISPNTNSMDFCPLKEKINVELLNYAIDNCEELEIPSETLVKMRQLKRVVSVRGWYEPQYQRTGVAGNGRIFCKRGVSAIGMKREWRNALAYIDYRDCDMVNACYQVALEAAIKYGVPHTHIKNYIDNREEKLKAKMERNKCSRDVAKGSYSCMLFKEHKKTKSNTLASEIQILHNTIRDNEEQVVKAVEADMKKKRVSDNKNGKIFAHYYQIREAEILRLAVLYLKREGQEVAGLLHDGCYIKKTNSDGEEKALYSLTSLNNYLRDTHGINIEFAYKPMRDLPSKLTEENLMLTREQALDREKARYYDLREEFEKEICKVITETKFIQETTTSDNKIKRIAYSTTGLKDAYCDWAPAKNFKTSLITGKKNPSLFIENYILDPDKRQYNYIDFIPDANECPEDVFNVFKGFAVARLSNTNPEITENDLNDFALLRDWLTNLFSDTTTEQTKVNVGYIHKWLANTFQNPTRRSEIMIILKGRKGIGKSDFCELIKQMIGKEHFFQTSDPSSEIFGKFNETLDRKTFVNIDEPTGLDNEANIEKMKGAITCKDLNIKRKFCDTESSIAYQNYFMTLNHENTGIHITSDNRRFAMFESAKMGYENDEYLPFYNAIRNPIAQVLFYRFLMTEIDLTNFTFTRDTIPKTDFLKRSQLNNIPNYHSYMEQFILGSQTKEVANFTRLVSGNWRGLCGDLYRGYLKFCDDIGADRSAKITQRSFKQEIFSLAGITIKRYNYGECFIIDTLELTSSLRILGLEVAVSNPSEEPEFHDSEDETGSTSISQGHIHTLADI